MLVIQTQTVLGRKGKRLWLLNCRVNKSCREKRELQRPKPFQMGKLTMHILLEQVVILPTAKLNPFHNNLYLQNIFGKGYSDSQPNIFYDSDIIT